jgi:Cu/Ag efflux protein CusF
MIMKRLYLTVAAVGLTAALAACGPNKPAEPAGQPTAAAPTSGDTMASTSMPTTDGASAGGDMSAADPVKMAKGEGTVTDIDKTTGSITIDHGPIPEANWGPMTMSFKAAPTILEGVKVGDKVEFDLKLKGMEGEVTAIHKK